MITLVPGLALATVGSWSALAIMLLRHRRARAQWAATLRAACTRAHTDVLTNLCNRAGLMHHLGARVRSREAWSLALLDADHFKPINDTLGHDVGDDVLTAVARRLHDSAGGKGIVARLGGDEFAIVLAGAPDETMPLVRQAVDCVAAPQLVRGLDLRLSMSAGVAGFEPGLAVLDLMRRADTALYHAKESGGRVVAWHEDVDKAEAWMTSRRRTRGRRSSASPLMLVRR